MTPTDLRAWCPGESTSVAKPKCRWCGSVVEHYGTCPKVRAIEYHPNGVVKRVEFHGPPPDHDLSVASIRDGAATTRNMMAARRADTEKGG